MPPLHRSLVHASILVLTVIVAVPSARADDYAAIARAGGPIRFDRTNACLLVFDEPAGATQAVDSSRTLEMVAQGWGNAPTAHHGEPTNIQFGVPDKLLLAGEADRCARFDGDSRLAPADPSAEFAFTVWSRFSFGFRFIPDPPAGDEPAEWTIVSRIDTGPDPASPDDDRGWRLTLRRLADHSLRLRMALIDNLATDALVWHECGTPVTPGAAHSVLVTFRGTSEAAGIDIYLDGHPTSVHTRFDGDGWWTSPRQIAPPAAALRLGSETDARPGSGFSGWMAGFFVQPRMLGPWDAAFLHEAATQPPPAVPIPRHANIGIIREALAGRCFARVIGDSTSVPGDTSVGDMIPRRLVVDSAIPVRIAHFKPFTSMVRSTPAPALLTSYGVALAPGAPWDAVPPRRPSYFTTARSARDVPDGEWECLVPDPVADVLDAQTFPRARVRILYTVGTDPAIAPSRVVSISNGSAADAAATLELRQPASSEFASVDLELASAAPPGASTSIRLLGGPEDETGTQFGAYGAWVTQADPAARQSPGLWWAGAIAQDGATTIEHSADGLIYDMAAVDRFDAALAAGDAPLFTHKVVFVLLTLNDLGADPPTDIVRQRLAAIAARWTSRGYRVCLVQPWLPLLSTSVANPDRLPRADAASYWRDAFLPLAHGEVACISLHEYFRGVPHQYLEGPSGPNYSLHARDSHSALRLLIPLGLALNETPPLCPADFNAAGGLTVQDIYDFLSAWSSSLPAADFNGQSGITVQDLYDFLTAWLAGCG